MLLKKIGKKLPVIEPDMKLTPTIKLIGKAIVSVLNKLTFLLLELFCMPIINNKNKIDVGKNNQKLAKSSKKVVSDITKKSKTKPNIKKNKTVKKVVSDVPKKSNTENFPLTVFGSNNNVEVTIKEINKTNAEYCAYMIIRNHKLDAIKLNVFGSHILLDNETFLVGYILLFKKNSVGGLFEKSLDNLLTSKTKYGVYTLVFIVTLRLYFFPFNSYKLFEFSSPESIILFKKNPIFFFSLPISVNLSGVIEKITLEIQS